MIKPRGNQVLLCALNSKYIHSTLALRCLRQYCKNKTEYIIDIAEFTINQPTQDVIAAIYQRQPDVLGFSCYIWNIELILKLCEDYKRVVPDAIIILGGPEVSYDSEQLLQQYCFIDGVVRGEGEETLQELLHSWQNGIDLQQIDGLTYRYGEEIISTPDRALVENLDQVPFPYQDEEAGFNDRVVYYESSRGCPYQCSYCLSSISRKVRYFSIARVKRDLMHWLDNPVREIKFVDRTFNLDESRTREIMQFIIDQGDTNKVHFEIDAGLISNSMLEFLGTVPPGLFNFEIGIQSTYGPALQAVRRRSDWERISRNVMTMQAQGKIHLHVDLIAGLPYEDLSSFRRSFDMVYALQADYLQLGFLKLLKGSPLRQAARSFGYQYQSHPPYQVLSNSTISYKELLLLSRIEKLVDWYYNPGKMKHTLAYLVENIYSGQAMQFYQELADYYETRSWFAIAHKPEILYSHLFLFIALNYPEYKLVIGELLKYDYLSNHHQYTLPAGLDSHNPVNIHQIIYAYAADRRFVDEYLPVLSDQPTREIKKRIHLEYFTVDPRDWQQPYPVWLMFVYHRKAQIASQVIKLDHKELESKSP